MKGKVTTSHLERRAFVYVRQSTMAQVFENAESQARQYGLADRARSLGWSDHSVEVIDEDLGKSGASTAGRTGFARLAKAVAYGEAGAVFALDVSRLARSSYDWQRLLSLCAVGGVLVIDESSVYDPGNRDDKLLLDLKGTMYEAELHWLSLRLAGSRRNKARRGELRLSPPTGYLWGGSGYEIDPDEAVREAVATVLARFEIETSAWAVVRWAHKTGLRFPKRAYQAGGGSTLTWEPLTVSRLCAILHNPVYAGAYAYGKNRATEKIVDGEIRRTRTKSGDPEEWLVLIRDAHPGYVTWERYVENQEKLRDNLTRPTSRGAPRQGKALLGGLLLCGRCGRPMSPNYSNRSWRYVCPGQRALGGPSCWSIAGWRIDAAVEQAFLDAMVPEELELSLAVEQQVRQQAEALQRQWKLRIEQAEYEARLAERRYMAVDPDNRVVIRTLERAWEERLRELEEVQQQYDAARQKRHVDLSAPDRARIRQMAADLPRVWRAQSTSLADKKAMLRLAIEVVVLHPVEIPERHIRTRVQWQGGAQTDIEVPWPSRREWRRTPKEATELIGELAAAGIHDEDIAERLNAAGLQTGFGRAWNTWAVRWARRQAGIQQTAKHKPRNRMVAERHADGRYSIRGASIAFGVSENTVRRWAREGLVEARREQDGNRVWWLRLDDAIVARLIAETESRRSARPRLPDRREDGRYSLPGLMRRYELSKGAVRGLIRRGRLTGVQEDYGTHRASWWIRLDDEADAALRETSERARQRRQAVRTHSKTTPSK